MSALHSWEYQRGLVKGFPTLSEEERAASPPVRHPLVRTHPQSGRRSLYISSSAQGIEDMDDGEARALLAELTRIATLPEHVYTHRWQPFDLMIWDNRCNLHRSDGFDYQSLVHRRLLHRVIVAGAPTAASAAA
ncbi:MAG: TauD/TfdA family dioxygenase [Pseudomonadota bacterium]